MVVDTLRADHLGSYGYSRPTSPSIDALARKGTLFENASASSSWTRPSVASLFTSRLPRRHGATAFDRPIADELPTLAERLSEHGYTTLGISGNFVHVTEVAGFGRGFDVFESFALRDPWGRESVWSEERPGAAATHLRAPKAREINAEVLRRLPEASDGPLFLYVHYMEPHSPFAPPERWRKAFARDPEGSRGGVASNERVIALAAGRAPEPGEVEWLVDLYDAEIASVDEAIGELVGALEERGFWDNAVLVLTSDHGEEFGEHGSFFHGKRLYRESLRVPLILVDARTPAAEGARAEPVDGLDVAPTMLALAGIGPAPGMRGRNLAASGKLPPRDLVAQLHPEPLVERRTGARTHRVAVKRGSWKGIATADGEIIVYRLDDKGEQRPLDPRSAPPELLATLAELLARTEAPSDPTPLEDDSIEGLRALGYVH